MIEILMQDNIYRKFTIDVYHSESVTILGNAINHNFKETVIVGDYIGIFTNKGIFTISEVTEIVGGLLKLDEGLRDGTYNAYVMLITPTKSFKELGDKIQAYIEKNPSDGLQSESIPNYSYTKSAEGLKGWQAVFKNDLKKYTPSFPIPICEWLCKLDSKL